MGQSNASSFTTYMQEMQRWERQRKMKPAQGGTALSLLGVLAQQGESMLLTDLQAASDMTFTEFAESVNRLKDSGYLTICGSPGSESAELTKLGAEIGSLARPASPDA